MTKTTVDLIFFWKKCKKLCNNGVLLMLICACVITCMYVCVSVHTNIHAYIHMTRTHTQTHTCICVLFYKCTSILYTLILIYFCVYIPDKLFNSKISWSIWLYKHFQPSLMLVRQLGIHRDIFYGQTTKETICID